MEDHMPMPGITVGDLGTKLGYNGENNGYMSFDNVRIPRADMLSRISHVNKKGEFQVKGDPRMLYNIMTQSRMDIINGSAVKLF